VSLTIGVDVGGTKVAGAVVDDTGAVVAETRRHTPADDVSQTLAMIMEVVEELHGQHPVEAIGVGAAGWIDAERSTVLFAPNIAWRNEPLRDELADKFGLPVVVENDANVAAWAEYRFGAGRDIDSMVMYTVGTGIGGAVIMDGRLIRGRHGIAAELGHVLSVPDGQLCGCGRRGCLEAVAGIRALVERVGSGPDPADLEPEVDDIVRRARSHEAAVVTALRDLGEHLGFAVSLLSNVVNPEVVLLGGYFVPLAPWLMPAAEAQLRAGTVAPDAGGCRLTASALGQVAAAIGGAASILDAVDAGTLPVPQKVGAGGVAKASITTA
jgi:glucokinase